MFLLEKLAYVSLSATGFAAIVLVHYLLSKYTSIISSSDHTTNTNVNKNTSTSSNNEKDDHDDHDDEDRQTAEAQAARSTRSDATAQDSCDPLLPKRSATDKQRPAACGEFLSKRKVIRASMSYRPRGVLARAVYEKVHNDQYLDGYDMQLWYKLQKPLAEARFQERFVPMVEPDSRTLRWLDAARMLSSNFWLQLWHLVARLVLTTFMTQTDANGFLKRGSMFILSEEQFGSLLRTGGFRTRSERPMDVLDIGAGDGEVTQRLINSVRQLADGGRPEEEAAVAAATVATTEPLQVRVFATEYSYTMRNRLQKKNFIVIDKLQEVSNVDLISCLNVLDRCADPHQIMADIHASLADDGRAIVALVLPYSHYVESNTSHMPLRSLLPHWPSSSRTLSFDAEATAFFEQLETMGFVIEAWTKAPYLCEGDMRQSFYWLIDVVVVLSKRRTQIASVELANANAATAAETSSIAPGK